MSWVYFFQASDGSIKIGTSYEVRQRWLEMRHYPRHWLPERFLGALRGSYREEHALHMRFAEERLRSRDRRSTEWFRPSPRLLDFIASLPEVSAADIIETPQKYVDECHQRSHMKKALVRRRLDDSDGKRRSAGSSALIDVLENRTQVEIAKAISMKIAHLGRRPIAQSTVRAWALGRSTPSGYAILAMQDVCGIPVESWVQPQQRSAA